MDLRFTIRGKKIHVQTLLLLAGVLFAGPLFGQDATLKVFAVNGRNGKPMPHQRLLVFLGETEKDVRFQKHSLDVTTDKDGWAVLPVGWSDIKWLDVFVDYRTLCSKESHLHYYSVDNTVSARVALPNTCSSFRMKAGPNQLIVFARPATLREKMAW